jgi:hypothetical protein
MNPAMYIATFTRTTNAAISEGVIEGKDIMYVCSAGQRREPLHAYNGLQLRAMKRLGHGLQGQVNYTWSRSMDTDSNGGFLPFSARGILSPLPGDLARDYGSCDYDVRHNLNAQYVYQCRFECGIIL